MTISRNAHTRGACFVFALLLSASSAWAQDASTATAPQSGAATSSNPTIAADRDTAQDPEDGASVLMYHRFGEGDYPSTNITLEQIDAHIAEIKSNGYTPMSLPDIVERLKSHDTFPVKTIGVSIDDAYLSVYSEAWPRFKRAGIPFTLFVATDPIDRGFSRYMSWEQIREMAADPLVTIGSQTALHLHMIDADPATNAADLEKSNTRFKEELGFVPNLIAYPYGEFDDQVVALVREHGFIAGFGQHSGAFGATDDIYRLARFAMNETYGDISRLRTAAAALPLSVSDFTPTDSVVSPDANPPAVGFTLPDDLAETTQIACYSNQEGKLKLERLGPRVEARMTATLPQGRTRLNCTIPITDASGETRWRWLGRLLYVK